MNITLFETIDAILEVVAAHEGITEADVHRMRNSAVMALAIFFDVLEELETDEQIEEFVISTKKYLNNYSQTAEAELESKHHTESGGHFH